MKTVLVFAGTTEGRELAERLSDSHIACHVCVATEYGNQLIKSSEYISVHSGRLDEAGMRKLYEDIGCEIIVDATHPYAQVVTDTIKKSISGTSIEYIRLLRKNDVITGEEKSVEYASIADCVSGLEKTEGNILLTTGSKQLKEFTEIPSLRKRIIARVLPGMESLGLCYEAGLEGKQIIAMQGPFSKEMNEAVIRDYEIRHLVTKESGVTGGVDSKIAAALDMGITVHMIKRPNYECTDGMSMEEAVLSLEKKLGKSIAKGKINVSLVGIGPGGRELFTKEAENAIACADYIFGASRMLETVESKAVKYAYYLKKDILPVLEDISKKCSKNVNIAILFSGDSGFYSGAAKMYEALKNETNYDIRVLPGISSVSILASKLGISWQDAELISAHGVPEETWITKLSDSVKHNDKTFFLTSGADDIQKIGEALLQIGGEYSVSIGKNMSYKDEQILLLSPEACIEFSGEGLYAGVVLSQTIKPRVLVPDMEDGDFIRGNVPMTKEAVRKLSVCRMKIHEGDIIYDIGAGTGSVSIQAAALSPTVKVYSLECNEDAIALTKDNVKKAGLRNITVIEAVAPEGMDELPKADVCFIGGSRGNLRAILDKLYQINPSMRVVMSAVSMENICEMNRILEELNVTNVSIEQIAITNVKEMGNFHMMSANNPVFMFAFDFAGE